MKFRENWLLFLIAAVVVILFLASEGQPTAPAPVPVPTARAPVAQSVQQAPIANDLDGKLPFTCPVWAGELLAHATPNQDWKCPEGCSNGNGDCWRYCPRPIGAQRIKVHGSMDVCGETYPKAKGGCQFHVDRPGYNVADLDQGIEINLANGEILGTALAHGSAYGWLEATITSAKEKYYFNCRHRVDGEVILQGMIISFTPD